MRSERVKAERKINYAKIERDQIEHREHLLKSEHARKNTE